MTNLQIRGAVVRVRDFLKPLTSDYSRMYTVRGILTQQLGYTPEQADEVLKYVASEGFAYCLDYTITVKSDTGRTTYPTQDVCHWNPDQLYSRICCVNVGPERIRHRVHA